MTYALDADVRAVLGKLGSRLPADVDVDTHLAMSHATVSDKLRDVYGDTIPEFADEGLEVVRWAEAKIAGASVLSTLLLSLPAADRESVRMLRAEGFADLERGVPGYPIGGVVDPDGPDGPAVGSVPVGPQSSAGASSLFPSPYDVVLGPDRAVTPWPGYEYGPPNVL